MLKLVEGQFMLRVTSMCLYHIPPLKTIMQYMKVQNFMVSMVTLLNLPMYKSQDPLILLLFSQILLLSLLIIFRYKILLNMLSMEVGYLVLTAYLFQFIGVLSEIFLVSQEELFILNNLILLSNILLNILTTMYFCININIDFIKLIFE